MMKALLQLTKNNELGDSQFLSNHDVAAKGLFQPFTNTNVVSRRPFADFDIHDQIDLKNKDNTNLRAVTNFDIDDSKEFEVNESEIMLQETLQTAMNKLPNIMKINKEQTTISKQSVDQAN